MVEVPLVQAAHCILAEERHGNVRVDALVAQHVAHGVANQRGRDRRRGAADHHGKPAGDGTSVIQPGLRRTPG